MLDELQRRNYSPATTRGYIQAIKQFAEYLGKSPEQLGSEEIRRLELHLLRDKKLAPETVEGRMSALRFLYKKALKRRDIVYEDLTFPKVPRKLPVVLSPEEVTRMIEAASSLLHRTILMVLYSTGIRRREASLLKVSDIDSERMVIRIQQGKGSRGPRRADDGQIAPKPCASIFDGSVRSSQSQCLVGEGGSPIFQTRWGPGRRLG
jgi:site-specific recombinase XerD